MVIYWRLLDVVRRPGLLVICVEQPSRKPAQDFSVSVTGRVGSKQEKTAHLPLNLSIILWNKHAKVRDYFGGLFEGSFTIKQKQAVSFSFESNIHAIENREIRTS